MRESNTIFRPTNLPRNISLNAATRLVTSVVEKALIFVVMALIGRRLGSQGLGVYSFTLAYLVFFRLLTDWGISPITIRLLSTARGNERSARFSAALTLRIILAVGAAVLAGVSFSIGGSTPLVKTCVWVAGLTLADVVTDICAALLLAELKQTWLGALEVGNRLLWAAAASIALLFRGGVVELLVILGCSSVIQMTSALWLARRLIKFQFRCQWVQWKDLLSSSWPLALQASMSTVYLRVDQLLLYLMVGVTTVGYYSAATKIAEVWGLAAGIFQAATYPLMCKFYSVDRESFEKTVRYGFRYLFIGILPSAVFCTLYATTILRLVFGEDFAQAGGAFVLLMWAEVFLVSNMFSQAALIAAGKEKWTLVLSLAAASANVLLNLVFIRRYSYVGAAWASLLSYGMYPVLGTLLPQTRYLACFVWRELWRPLLAALATGALLFYLPSNAWRLFIGTFFYVAFLAMLKGVQVQDLVLLRRAIVQESPVTTERPSESAL